MPNHNEIYNNQAANYELLISREDYHGNIMRTIHGIVNVNGMDIVDIDAGTGRLSRLLAPEAKSLIASDLSEAMLKETSRILQGLNFHNWTTVVADMRNVPVPSDSADLIVAGWTVCYLASSNLPEWRSNIDEVIAEMDRILRRDGTIIIFETLGTGYETANPPDFLVKYYQVLEQELGFQFKSIRTDYEFESVQEAEGLTQFFFGDDLADRVKRENLRILPECTGVWWKRK